MFKNFLVTVLVLGSYSFPSLACVGDPESISVKRLEALLEGLKENKDFMYALGDKGTKNINFNGELVVINLETNVGEKSTLVYRTTPVNIPMSDPKFECDKRRAILIK